MNPRQTHIRAIDISSNIFDTYDTAIKEANALKAYIKYTCEKKGFSCIAFIGVSKCDSQWGKIKVSKYGKREITPIKDEAKETNPHIHIILLSNPNRTLSDLIEGHLSKKYGKKVTWTNKCEDYLAERIRYVINQTSHFRKVVINPNILEPIASNFIFQIETQYQAINNPKRIFQQI